MSASTALVLYLAQVQNGHWQGGVLSSIVLKRAVILDGRRVLQLAIRNQVPAVWDERTNLCTWAASVGRLELLQWLHEQGCPLTKELFFKVAKGAGEALHGLGHNACIEWAAANGCPLPSPLEIRREMERNGGMLSAFARIVRLQDGGQGNNA